MIILWGRFGDEGAFDGTRIVVVMVMPPVPVMGVSPVIVMGVSPVIVMGCDNR